ncbi:SPFH domain-containing protein [Candidatus Sumerlaeota bacterium]
MAKVYKMAAGAPTKRQTTLAILAVLLVLVALFLATGVGSCVSKIDPTEVAVVINNITGRITARIEPGWIVHLPYGLTDVYKLDKRVQSLVMSQATGSGDRRGVDNVRIKSNDGSNVYIDIEVAYAIDRAAIIKVVTELGRGEAYKKNIVRHYIRSLLRDQFGLLTVKEITSPVIRNEKTKTTRLELLETMEPFGIRIDYVSATNFDFNPQFKQMVNERIAAEQNARNESAAQETKKQVQLTEIAQATREKETAVIKESAAQNKLEIQAKGKAEQLVKEAIGQATATKTDGDRMFKVAEAEAEAIRAEGLNKAQGIKVLADAYKAGGISLVREALALKYKGRQINGRPYSLSSHVDRLQLEQGAAAAAAPAARKEGQ